MSDLFNTSFDSEYDREEEILQGFQYIRSTIKNNIPYR